MKDPYFDGQRPAECGHYYPDVLRLRDERSADGTFVRIVDCRYCGRSELPLDLHQLDKQLARKLKRNGLDVGVREEEIDRVRQRALERITAAPE